MDPLLKALFYETNLLHLDEPTGRVEFKTDELRVPCKPGDIIATDHHMHRCEACDVTWKHPDSIRLAADARQFHEAHLCPSCGDHITDKLD